MTCVDWSWLEDAVAFLRARVERYCKPKTTSVSGPSSQDKLVTTVHAGFDYGADDELDFDEGPHHHPELPSVAVEAVAYARKHGGWDLYLFEPKGSLPPEFEASRVDQFHIFLRTAHSHDEISQILEEVEVRLWPDYCRDLYYRESGGRRVINKITGHLDRHGAQHMWVSSVGNGDYELRIRRKDFPLAAEIVASNIKIIGDPVRQRALLAAVTNWEICPLPS